MTGQQFERLTAWQQAHPGRSVDIKLSSREREDTICLCSAEEEIGIVWISPEEIGRIDDVIRERSVKRAGKENAA